MIAPDELSREFAASFGRSPRIFGAPGRVNLIGEHTDYNDGFVMPMAIDRFTWVAAAARHDRTLVVRSREFKETRTIDLDHASGGPTGHWSDYVRGIAIVLDDVARPVQGRDRGAESPALHGADVLIHSNVPIGAGLSSSAALEIACGFAFLQLSNRAVDLTSLALAAQRAEHQFAGTRCGVMDQMIACHARSGTLVKLDTRSLACEWVPMPPALRVLVCNTMVSHALASNEYNARRADCEAGVRIIAARFPEVRALRDATGEQLDEASAAMTERVARRCRHVISENGRVDDAAAALRDGDYHAVGRLMAESHQSLRDDYEVSCAELDTMVAIVSALPGVYGARMTGGGFGGSVVAVVDADMNEDRMRTRIQAEYCARTGLSPDVWFCAAADGVAEWRA